MILYIFIAVLCLIYGLTYYVDPLYYIIHDTKTWKLYHDIIRYKKYIVIKEHSSYPEGGDVFTFVFEKFPMFKNWKLYYTYSEKDVWIVGASNMMRPPKYFCNKLVKIFNNIIFKEFHY